MFNFRQLSVYEVCVHKMSTEKATCYSYYEDQVIIEPNEVATLLKGYIRANANVPAK